MKQSMTLLVVTVGLSGSCDNNSKTDKSMDIALYSRRRILPGKE